MSVRIRDPFGTSLDDHVIARVRRAGSTAADMSELEQADGDGESRVLTTIGNIELPPDIETALNEIDALATTLCEAGMAMLDKTRGLRARVERDALTLGEYAKLKARLSAIEGALRD